MALTKPIGFMTCPECDHEHAEIKQDKNGHAYRYCPECNTQTFTRDDVRSERMIKKMRPVEAATTQTSEKTNAPISTQKKPAENAPSVKKSGLLLD